jgi:hypothetical protein
MKLALLPSKQRVSFYFLSTFGHVYQWCLLSSHIAILEVKGPGFEKGLDVHSLVDTSKNDKTFPVERVGTKKYRPFHCAQFSFYIGSNGSS